MKRITILFLSIIVATISSCNKKQETNTEPLSDSTVFEAYQATVTLPPPDEKDSEVKYSKVIGWPEGQTPDVPDGFHISKFITGMKSPRNIYIAPNGDIFVAFANTESKGLKKKITDEVTGRDESQHTQKSLNQIYIFRDQNGDGKPEIQELYLTGLNQPFGMLVLNNFFLCCQYRWTLAISL